MKLVSHVPAQTNPLAETVTRLVLLLEKLTSATTVVPSERCGVAAICITCPGFKESEVGVRTILLTVLVLAALVPLQPGRRLKIKTENKAATIRAAQNSRMYPPRRVGSDGCVNPNVVIPVRVSQCRS